MRGIAGSMQVLLDDLYLMMRSMHMIADQIGQMVGMQGVRMFGQFVR